MSLLRTTAFALFLSACAPPLELGAPCGLTSECPTPYACVLGRCRSECDTNRDCFMRGGMCLADESGMRACRIPEEEECSGACGDGLACVDARCVQTCEETADCAGTLCGDRSGVRVCLEPTSAPCTADAECGFSTCEAGACDPPLDVAAGGAATCVLLESGRLACAGSNVGYLHHFMGATAEPYFIPLVDGAGLRPDFEDVELGLIHGCALTNGRVRCWGGGDFGQNGTMAAAPPLPGPISSLLDVEQIAAAYLLSCARTASDVLCFGSDQFGQLGDATIYGTIGPTSASPVRVELPAGFLPTRIATGGFHGCAVGSTGTVQCWGGNDYEQLGVVATATCPYEGRDYGCSQTPIAIAGFGPGEIVAVDVALGQSHTCVLDDRGGVHCFGRNQAGQLGGTPTGDHVPGRITPFTSGVRAIDAGTYYTCALLEDGRLSCWGLNDFGQLGTNGPSGSAPTPTDVVGLDDVIAFSCGDIHACAVQRDGSVWCWGGTEAGRLGDGRTEMLRQPIPVRVRVGGP